MSLWNDLRNHAVLKYLDFADFLRQRRLILDDPQLTVSDPERRITINSISFAARGCLVVSSFFAIGLTVMEAIPTLDMPTMEQLEFEAAEQAEAARRAEMARRGGAGDLQGAFEAWVTSETYMKKWSATRLAYKNALGPFVTAIQITMVTIAFGLLLRLFTRPRPAEAAQSERAFLYALTAQLFWPMTCASALFFFLELQGRLRLSLDWVAFLFVPVVIWQWRNVWRLGRMLRDPLRVSHAKGLKTADRIVARRAVAAMVLGSVITAGIISTAATMRAETRLGQFGVDATD